MPDEETIREIVRDELQSQSSTTRRGLLAMLGGGAAAGAMAGSASGEVTSDQALSVGDVTANTYRISENRYGGVESARSELATELGDADAGAKFAAQDTGAEYHWTGSAWELMDGKTKSFSTDEVTNRKFIREGDTAADIQSKIDTLALETPENGKGVLYGLNKKVVLDSMLTIKTGVYIKDATFKQADGANLEAHIKSENFDSLTGTDTFTDAPHNFGFENVIINGNRANNTSGAGIKVYARHYSAHSIFIYDCPGDGYYSEGGSETIGDWYKQPEASVGPVWSSFNGGTGVVFNGPHDSEIGFVMAHKNDGQGFVMGDIEGTHNSDGLRMDSIHTNNNGTEPGIEIQGTCYPTWMYPDGDNLLISGEVRGGGTIQISGTGRVIMDGETNVNQIVGFGLEKVADGPVVDVNADDCHVDHVRLRKFETDAISVSANGFYLGGGMVFDIGGYGLNLGDGVEVNEANITLQNLNKCDSGGFRYGGGTQNVVDLRSYISSGFTGWDLANSSLPSFNSDEFNFAFRGPGSNEGQTTYSRSMELSGADGSKTMWTVSHDVLKAPDKAFVLPTNSAAITNQPTIGVLRDDELDINFETAPSSNPTVFWWAGIQGQQM